MDFKEIIFLEGCEHDMISFVERNWDRIHNVFYHDDFDGCYWCVRILKEKRK